MVVLRRDGCNFKFRRLTVEKEEKDANEKQEQRRDTYKKAEKENVITRDNDGRGGVKR